MFNLLTRNTALRLCLVLLLGAALIGLVATPAEARAKRHNSDRGHHNSERGHHNSDAGVWNWHPGAIGQPLGSWRNEFAEGLTFGIGGDGWGLSYRDGNTRFRYSRGGYWTVPNTYLNNCYTYQYGRPARRQHGYDFCGPQYPYGSVIVIGGYGDPYYYGGQPYGGYADPLYVDGYPVYSEGPGVYNDNSVTNNYYGDVYSTEPAAQQAASRPFVGPQPPAAPQPPSNRALGVRFFDKTRLETPDGVFICSLVEGKLYCGREGAKAALAAKGANPDYGAFAAYLPGQGIALIYVSDGSIFAAYDTGAGKWWAEALPLRPQLSAGLSLGLIGNEPWAAFNDAAGTRYVYSWSGQSWIQIGSATRD